MSTKIIADMNLVRSNPAAYANIVARYSTKYSATDMAETLNYLRTVATPAIPFAESIGLNMVAQKWADYQGPRGTIG